MATLVLVIISTAFCCRTTIVAGVNGFVTAPDGLPTRATSFSAAERNRNCILGDDPKGMAARHTMVLLRMGLYDTPLPPRPPSPRDEGKKKQNEPSDDDDDDDEIPIKLETRLFEFTVKGKEVNDLLPPLGRRLDSGVDCYFEPTDRLVRNLVNKTACSVPDACWALEACRGDITEAWTRISMARRLQLQRERETSLRQEDEDYDPEDYDMEVLDEFERRKKKMRGETEQRRRDEYFKLSQPNDEWLPIKNPKPIDDEPWFTG